MNNVASIEIKKKAISLECSQVEVPRMLKFFIIATTDSGKQSSFEARNVEGKWQVMQPVPNWLPGNENLVFNVLKDYIASSPQAALE